VVQSLVLVLGPIICVTALLMQVPGGLAGIWQSALADDKLSLGSFSFQVDRSTFWVVLVYGLTINLGNFGIDQSYVQRYITTRTDRDARHSVWLTACLYVPVSGLFFFIGTALYALYTLRPELAPTSLDFSQQPDKVFPYFISHQLPLGLGGLVVAAIFAASLDSTLGSMATLTLCDLYKRYLRPDADEAESLRVLRGATLGWGLLGTAAALAMIHSKNVLDVWWDMAGIFSGGMLGLFLLGLISRAGNAIAATSVSIGLCVIVWMTASRSAAWPAALAVLRSPFHSLMVTVIGTLTILFTGLLLSTLAGRSDHGERGA
jgi:SSS family solute:Na+ symporter